jgi:succinoglycan biosynthesis transport protein ExoP
MSSPSALSQAAQLQPEPDIQLFALWQAVKRSWKPLLIAAGVIGALTYGAMSLMASRFTSESQLEFVSRRNNPLPEAGERAAVPDNAARLDQAAMNTHARALLSSDLLLKVAGELKLRNRPEFNSAVGSLDTWTALNRMAGIGVAPPGETEEERVLAVVRRQVEVSAIKDTRSIAIRFTSADNNIAAQFANRLAETYRASLVAAPVEETSKAVEALTPKVEALRKEVLDAEGAVERFRSASDQFRSGPQSSPVADQRMAGLQDELLKVEAAKNEAEARWRTARELMKSGSAEVLPDVQKSALVQGLIQQRVRLERQIAETSAALLPGHPRMQQLNADVAGLRRQIAAEVEKVVQSIEKDARSAAIRVEAVQKQIAALKTKVTDNSGNEARLKELESVARSKRTELDRLQKQLEDNRTVVNIRQVPIEAQIISRAMVSNTPVFPRKAPVAALAAAATLILGFAFVITKALVSTVPTNGGGAPRPKGRREEQVEPMLVVPTATTAGAAEPRLQPGLRPVPPIASLVGQNSTIGSLADKLASRQDAATGLRTLVTTESAGVDPAPEALVLAEQLSRAGRRVGLVVWNLTGNGIEISRTSLRKPGLTDLMQGHAGFEDVIGRLPGSNVHLIQPGSPPANKNAVLDPDRLNLTLDALDEAYEHIVVVASSVDAATLFEAIEGRFDVGVVVCAGTAIPRDGETPGMLLGFEVNGIDVVRVPQTLPARTGPAKPAAAKPSGKPGKKPTPGPQPAH